MDATASDPIPERLAERARHWLERQGARMSRALPPPPFLAALSRIENQIVDSILLGHADAIATAQGAFSRSMTKSMTTTTDARAGRAVHTEAMEVLAERLITELRARMECVPWDRPGLASVARLDQRLPTDVGEQMDNAALKAPARRRLVEALDRQTRRAGDYLVLADLLEPLLPKAAGTPPGPAVTVLDIGSGPAGFALAVARVWRHGRHLRIVASDINEEYLEIGKAGAAASGLSDLVTFRRIDAFSLLDELGDWRPDIITCTRTLHHFGIRGTTRILALALQSAGRGVLFVDIARSISRMLMAAGAGLTSGNWHFMSDAVISVRKSFTPGEMRLIAACVPGGSGLEVFYTPPAYLVARGSGSGAAPR